MLPVPDAPLAVLPYESSFDELPDPGSDHALTDSYEVVDANSLTASDALLQAREWQASVSRSRGFHRKPVDPDFHALCDASIALADLTPERPPSASLPEGQEGGSRFRAAARQVIELGTAYLRRPSAARSIDRLGQARELQAAALARVREHLDRNLEDARRCSSGVSLVNAYKAHAMYCLDFFGNEHLPAIKDDLQVKRYDFLPLELDPSPLSQDLAPAAGRMLLRESLAQIPREETLGPDHPACLPVFIPDLGHGVLSIHQAPSDTQRPLTQQIAVILNLVAPEWTSDGRPRDASSTILRPSMIFTRLQPALAGWLRTLDVDALHDRLRQERDRIVDVLTMRAGPLPAALDSSHPQSVLSDEQLRRVANRLERLKDVVAADASHTLADLTEDFQAGRPARVHVVPPASQSRPHPQPGSPSPSPSPSSSSSDLEDDDPLGPHRWMLNQRVPPDLYKMTFDDLTDSDESPPSSTAGIVDRPSSMDSNQEPRL